MTAASSDAPPETLRRGSLNLRRLIFIGLAYFSLVPVLYLNMASWRPTPAARSCRSCSS